MPNPNAAPQTPGNLKIEFTPDKVEISMDGNRLEQHVSSVTFKLDTDRRPILELELLPGSVDLTASGVRLAGEVYDLLVSQGWRPPYSS